MLLEIRHLSFSYSPDRPLFQNFNLALEPGRIMALAGESGCGKSTLLSIIYGLIDWHEGDIIFDGKAVFGPKKNIVPGEAGMKLVAQNYDLMPYATVAENVGKFISNINLQEKRERVSELLDVVGLSGFANTLPKFLSGGQQQRVAIARALSVIPKLLLLDEPFSNLDYPRKLELREKLFSYVRKMDISLIISTHEILEIMPWLDRIVVLKDGRLIQNDSPEETFKNPYNEYVARLFGELNVLTEHQMTLLKAQKKFCYPHELRFDADGTKAEVLESRFAGSYFWNKLKLADGQLLMYSDDLLEGQIKVSRKKN
ncbi:sulfate/molybdate ABC transporter ATP-binding protein [Kaistella pullorum]|uniref:ABC transporter ATP-binding protein n=1 Tax=Kaistella pullorum TaxID=2763074 RepID=A0ABR8WKZ4_9FLAO|nr:ABC transporter ATP-binding protein [Kaistella pullorum]MBD8017753.1 ABC transporter ATP-binding protein [Kaistella pullorum]